MDSKEEKQELSESEKKAAKDIARRQKKGKLRKDFAAFINRGSVVDMSIGVIMGSAFGAIVTAFTNILLSLCTWGVPGGIKGLVTVLPAANAAQAGMDVTNGLGQFFKASELQGLAEKEAIATYGQAKVDATPTLVENVKSTILGKYTLHGTTYTYNLSAVIDWGTFLNAIITFFIIALTLFFIAKAISSIKAKQDAFNAALAKKEEEAWEKQHPEAAKKLAEERAAAEAAKKAGVPEKPENIVLLTEIRDSLRTLAPKAAPEAEPTK